MKFSRILLLFFLIFIQSLLYAQLPPALMHKQGDKSLPLRIDTVDVKITAIGNIAQTEMTLVFYNDLNRRLEGKLYFPLAEGQTVSGFALDVNREMRKGVVAEKQKGRKVSQQMGIRSRISKKFIPTTDSRHDNPVAENLLDRKFFAPQMGLAWVSDITYKTQRPMELLNCND